MSDSLVSAQSFPGLVLLGIAVLASLNLFYRDRPEGEDPLHLIMTVIGRVMIVTAFLEACVVFLNFLAPVFVVILIGILIDVACRYWLRRRMSLLAALAAAARRWMPLAPAVQAFSCEWRGFYGRRCRRLAESLDAGMSPGQALRYAGPFVPRRAVALIEAGGRCGNLAGALAEAVRQPATQMVLARIWSAVWYLSATLFAGAVSLTFIMVKIVPAYIKIFDDFDAKLPGMTLMLIDVCNWFVYGWPLLLLACMSAACFVVLWTFDMIAWLPPPLNTLARRKETVVVLRALAVTSEANRPLLPAVAALAEYYPSVAIRVRLKMAMDQMAQGQPWLESLADQGFLRRGELALVTSALRVGNLPWALREVADGIERRLALRLERGLEIVVPILVLIVGALVMLTVVSLFVPTIRLIEGLT
ncbi:MAG TPA: type II secretion system F family protein [Pirellulales bacterium]|nr:type II secretion system F family protein [Pirellulales bacterium]